MTVNCMTKESVIVISNKTGDEDKLEPSFDRLLLEGAKLSLTIQRSSEINSIAAQKRGIKENVDTGTYEKFIRL